VALKIYSVHVRPADAGREQDIVLVREGFSVWAFLFQVLWALYHRLWLVALLFLVIGVASEALAAWFGLSPGGKLVLAVATATLIGAEANNLRRWTLARRGYQEVDIIAAHSLDEAEERHFGNGLGTGAMV